MNKEENLDLLPLKPPNPTFLFYQKIKKVNLHFLLQEAGKISEIILVRGNPTKKIV